MALEVRVSGAATLHRVAAQMRAEGRKDLSRAMSDALSKAAEPVKREVRASAGETMPREGGYNAAFLKSLRFRVARKGGSNSATITLTTYADGSSERRDVNALEAGRLRHPVYGRSRPGARKGERHANPWAVTSIRAGFWKRGTDNAADESARQLESVIEDYAHRLVSE
jgi:hypothetical protein